MIIYNFHTREFEPHDKSEIGTRDVVAALGSFDGVHIGHQKLIETAVAEAKRRGILSVVWMFSELPRNSMLSSMGQSVPIITSIEEKLYLFSFLGLDYALFEDFSAVRNLTPAQFTKNVLIDSLRCVNAICGFNFRFGAGGAGDSDMLIKTISEAGYSATVVPPVYYQNKIVSSSAVRQMISDGAAEDAYHLLGRAFSINFPVVYGNQLGRTINIPTINQNFPEGHIIPKIGIYACTCEVGDDIFLGVSNIGIRPTVDRGGTNRVNCETHIIKYNGWLYGKNIRVNFYKRLRDERKFSGVDELREMISRDIANTIDYFSAM